MKYTEMIELYKEGKLDDEKKKEVQNDIERHEAISDYLYENEQIPSVFDVEGGVEKSADKSEPSPEEKRKAEEQARQETEKIIRLIKKRFRKGFVRFGIILLVLVLVVVGIFEWIVPNWLKSRYYDPIGAISESSSPKITQFEKDMRVYTNLFAPDKNWDDISVTDLGSGKYGLSVAELCPDISCLSRMANIDYTTDYYKYNYVSGSINQGVLELNGDDVFSPRLSYPFYPALAGVSNESRVIFWGSGGDTSSTGPRDMSSVSSVNNSGVYNIYVTFDKVYGYEDAIKMLSEALKNDHNRGYGMMSLWFAACQKFGGTYEASATLGFYANCNSYNRYFGGDYLEQLYNGLSREDYFDKESLRKSFEAYFSESLRHIADSKDFTMMTGCNEIKPYKRKSDSEDYYEDGYTKGGIEYPENTDLDTRYECLSEYLNRFADNVEKNGIYTYGCYYEGVRGETIKELAKDSHISYIYIENVG